jgi:hypothetical protein
VRTRASHASLRQPRHDDLHASLDEEIVVFHHQPSLLIGVELVVVRVELGAHLLVQKDGPDLRIGAVPVVEDIVNALQAQMTHRRQLAPGRQLTELGGIHGETVTCTYGRRGEEVRLEVAGSRARAGGEEVEEAGRYGG